MGDIGWRIFCTFSLEKELMRKMTKPTPPTPPVEKTGNVLFDVFDAILYATASILFSGK
jgi:hypothetical protein